MRFVATARESGYGIVFWEDPDMSVISPGQAPTAAQKKKGLRAQPIPGTTPVGGFAGCFLHPRKLTWIPNMMVWKRWFILNMAVLGIQVSFWGVSLFVLNKPLVN